MKKSIFFTVFIIMFTYGQTFAEDVPKIKGKSFMVKGGETRQVLNPLWFEGQARAAYGAAKKYPKVMDQVYCYCECDNPPFNHKSLLSCFAEDHGYG